MNYSAKHLSTEFVSLLSKSMGMIYFSVRMPTREVIFPMINIPVNPNLEVAP